MPVKKGLEKITQSFNQRLSRPIILANAGLQATILVRPMQSLRGKTMLEALLNRRDKSKRGKNITI
jgi:hypothetical protein